MPITKSAEKAMRSSRRKAAFNLKRKEVLQRTIKKYKKLVVARKMEEAQKMIPILQKVIDKATKRGLLKKNTASRRKSSLVRIINFKE